MHIRSILILIAVLALPVVAVAESGADTPAEAVLNLRDALIDGDQEAFVACFDANELEAQMLGAFFRMAEAAINLDEEVTEAFGEEAAATFSEDGPGDLFGELEDVTEDDLLVEIDGDAATVVLSNVDEIDEPMDLVLTDDGWLITFDDEPPSAEEAEQAIRMIDAMAQVMNNVADSASDDGMTVEALKEQLEEEMMTVMMMMSEMTEEEVVDDE